MALTRLTGNLGIVADALITNPKFWTLLAILGPVTVLGLRDAAREWTLRQWGLWFLRLAIVLLIGASLVFAAFRLTNLVSAYSRPASAVVFFSLLISGMVWGISGFVEALFALREGRPFPHLYDPSTRPQLIVLTVMLVGSMVVGVLGAELFGMHMVRGIVLFVGVTFFSLGALAPSSVWESDHRIARLQGLLGKAGARAFYAGLGLVLVFSALFVPASAFGK